MKKEHTTERGGQVEVIMTDAYFTKKLEDIIDEDVKLVDIPPEEASFILGDFRDELFDTHDLFFDEHESEVVKGEQVGKLIKFCEPYIDKVPTLYQAALFSRDNGQFMYVTF